MPVNPVTSATAAGPSAQVGAITASSTAPTESSSDTWMKMLLAQVRNPNPFGDNDPTAMVGQMAQFQMVSELNEVGKVLKGQAAASQVQTASSLLGRQITYLDAGGNEKTGTVSGLRVTSDGAKVTVGAAEVALSQLRTVTAAATTTGPAPAAGAGTSGTTTAPA